MNQPTVTNNASDALPLYVVHKDDAGKPVEPKRVVATLILMRGDSCTLAEFEAYLNISGCAFPAALVAKNGTVVFADPRKF